MFSSICETLQKRPGIFFALMNIYALFIYWLMWIAAIGGNLLMIALKLWDYRVVGKYIIITLYFVLTSISKITSLAHICSFLVPQQSFLCTLGLPLPHQLQTAFNFLFETKHWRTSENPTEHTHSQPECMTNRQKRAKVKADLKGKNKLLARWYFNDKASGC